MTHPFSPATHRLIPTQRWFEDFAIGERFPLPSRTMTEAIFLTFQAAFRAILPLQNARSDQWPRFARAGLTVHPSNLGFNLLHLDCISLNRFLVNKLAAPFGPLTRIKLIWPT